jgi:hypothetical protein
MLVRQLLPSLEEIIAAAVAAMAVLAGPAPAGATPGPADRVDAASGERAPPPHELIRCLTSAPQGPPPSRPSFRAARVAAAHPIRERLAA